MEPESVRSTESVLPEQRDESADSPSVPSEVLIPTPRQVEPRAAGPEVDAASEPGPNPDADPAAVPGADPAGDRWPGARPERVPAALTARERAVLDFEKGHWRYSGAKEQAVRERFDVSATRYYQLLNALLDRPEALAAEPVLVNRLRREREARRRSRSSHHGDGT